MTTYSCEHALLPGGVTSEVVVEIRDGRFSSVVVEKPDPSAIRLTGLTVPGFANCHSHAFHRALRGRTQRERGSFWTWREQMYSLADRLDPDSYYELARAVYREMAAAGITSVGEFHYLHHRQDGSTYGDANAFGSVLIAAARDVGLRIALLDTCYLASGIGQKPAGVQRRFSDVDVDSWLARVEKLTSLAGNGVVIGAAAHSVRAVPRDALSPIGQWATGMGSPLHMHLSEQPAENEACQAAYGCSPTELLRDAGVLGPSTTVVHATHLSERDIEILGGSGTIACFCPTTERDLGDGIGPSRQLRAAGSLLTLGSDSHAVIDPFEEMRALELDERLASQLRGHWTSREVLDAGTTTGHASLGFPDAGRIEVGARADLVTLDLESPRTAGTGCGLEAAVFAASAADVVHVVCDGRVVATRHEHESIGRELAASIATAWGEP